MKMDLLSPLLGWQKRFHCGVFLLHFLTVFVIFLFFFFILHFVSNEVQELNASLLFIRP